MRRTLGEHVPALFFIFPLCWVRRGRQSPATQTFHPLTKDPFIFKTSACPMIPHTSPLCLWCCAIFSPLDRVSFHYSSAFQWGGRQGQQAYLKCSPKAVQRFLLSFSSGWWVTETVCEDVVKKIKRNLRVFCRAVCLTQNPRRAPSPRHHVQSQKFNGNCFKILFPATGFLKHSQNFPLRLS